MSTILLGFWYCHWCVSVGRLCLRCSGYNSWEVRFGTILHYSRRIWYVHHLPLISQTCGTGLSLRYPLLNSKFPKFGLCGAMFSRKLNSSAAISWGHEI